MCVSVHYVSTAFGDQPHMQYDQSKSHVHQQRRSYWGVSSKAAKSHLARWIDGWMNRRMARLIDWWTHRQTEIDRWTDRQIDEQTNWKLDRLTDRWTDQLKVRQTDRQTDEQTDGQLWYQSVIKSREGSSHHHGYCSDGQLIFVQYSNLFQHVRERERKADRAIDR